jgi:hypothetical protein
MNSIEYRNLIEQNNGSYHLARLEMEEEYEDDEIVVCDSSYANLIDTLHTAHMDNARLRYYARGPQNREFSQMPLTPFIYEFFLFNSLYQIDWSASNESSGLIFHPHDKTEVRKQGQFVKFLRDNSRSKPELLQRAFDPIFDIEELEGSWTRVNADSRISDADGFKFFAHIRELQNLLRACPSPGSLTISNSKPDLDGFVEYINKVRNNIFHGSKTLGDAADRNQKRRIEVYELVLKGLTSLFFLAVGKDQAACDIIPCAVNLGLESPQSGHLEANREQILDWTSRQLMKVGDSRLIARFVHLAPPSKSLPDENSALFYPSAGKDMLTPLLLALPYCTRFYFYERSQRRSPPPQIQFPLRAIASPIPGSERLEWADEAGRRVLKCIVGGINRTIYWCHSDNSDFLNENVDLQFYFHRGDSWGEGGSGQKWDSDLLPKLLSKIPKARPCLYVTDGFPGGFATQYSSESFELNLPFVERGRIYYCGRLRYPR